MNMSKSKLTNLKNLTGLSIFNKNKNKKQDTKIDNENMIENDINDVSDINFGEEKTKKNESLKKKKRYDDNNIKVDFGDLKISQVETNKNKIFQRFLMNHNVVSKHPGVSIFCGGVGSGKTTLIHNLLSKPQYYGKSLEGIKDNNGKKPYFDVVFLLTGSDDDMYQELIDMQLIDENHIKFDPEPEDIQHILDIQGKCIKEKGLLNSPKVLIILEDIVDKQKFIKSTPFRSLFIKPRQNGLSVWLLSQYLNLIPKSCRLQAMNLYLFKQERAGQEIICEQYCPAGLKKDQFLKLIEQATQPTEDEPNPFLHINQRVKDKNEKFRRNLDTIILTNKK